MKPMLLNPIGTIHANTGDIYLEVHPEFAPALSHLQSGTYINVLWWFSRCDTLASRSKRVEQKPYKGAPDVLGTFATRSPERPNPIALSCCFITYVDLHKGLVGLAYIDADDGTPLLDIKPYTPSLDRVESPQVPAWCAHWPKSVEASGEFDWGTVFSA